MVLVVFASHTVPQTNVSRISIGDMVKVDIAGAGTHQGQVAKIASQTSAATRTFDVEITVPMMKTGYAPV